MAKKTVYIETSIPSAYVDERDHTVSRYQRDKTRSWWMTQRRNYDLLCSDAVLDELLRESFPGQAQAVELVGGLDRLMITDEVVGLAEIYKGRFLMPRERSGDAIHMALASAHNMDYLLTWNCRHLANPNKHDHLVAINLRFGLMTPISLTPEMLLQE